MSQIITVSAKLFAAQSGQHGIPVCFRGMQGLHVSPVSSQSNGGWREIHGLRSAR